MKQLIYNTQELIDKALYINLEKKRGFISGIQCLDKIARIDRQQLTIVTGKANNGKSTFLDYYCYMLASTSNIKTLFLSFETEAVMHNALFLKYAEQNIIRNNFLFGDTTQLSTVEDIVNVIQEAKQTYNIDNVVIDPFNYISTNQTTDTNAICHVLKTLKQAAQINDTSIILIAHPKKLGSEERLNGESICGSIHFRNVADIILLVHTDFINHTTQIEVDKLRYNKLQGEIGGTATLSYSNGRYLENISFDTLFDSMYNAPTKKTTTNSIEVAKQVLKEYNANKTTTQQIEKNDTIDYDKLMETKVGFLNRVTDKTSETITLCEAINRSEQYKEKQEQVRKLIDKPSIQEYKKNNIAAFTPSVVFNSEGTRKENVIEKNNIICIDIDGQDNKELSIQEMKDKVKHIPYIFYAQESIGGKGIFCLVQIKDTDKFKEHFNALQKLFEQHNLIIDAQCNDINRKRFVAYDNKQYINKEANLDSRPLKYPFPANSQYING